jgi:lipopolysaccharide transport system permease protein
MLRHLRELHQHRVLLWSLVQRELKARYRGSVLGFLWTFMNPLLLMLVYSLIFGMFMKSATPHYTYFMFVGLLPWICFSTSIGVGASTISDRRDLLTKVRFPAQVLPATVIGTNLLNYLLSLPLMIGLGAVSGLWPTWTFLFFPLILLVQTLFTFALLLFVSALNVAFRDLQHIVANVLTLGFFVTPIVFSAQLIPERLGGTTMFHDLPLRALLIYGNPMAVLTTAYQAIFYDLHPPELLPLVGLTLFSLLMLFAATRVFEARREQFAELI